MNHRLGLYDAILVKDNHIALVRDESTTPTLEALRRVRAYLRAQRDTQPAGGQTPAVIEIEVDTLEELTEVLPAQPDIVLLDNMSIEELRRAVTLRDAADDDTGVLLEASGGVSLDTVAAIAATGVDRISVGALTHSAPPLDLGLDWQ